MERVAIYNRCSTEEENQVNALEIQAEESREIAEQMNWIVIEQYVESQSGTTVGKRQEYLRMVQDIEAGRFDIVMIKSIDRLARNVKDWYLFLDCITRNDTRLYLYLDHSFYKSDDALITGIKAILAEEFSKELSKKIKNAHKRRQEKKTGLNISRPMFGWEKTGKDTFIVNEEEAAYFRRACVLVEQGLGYRRIAEVLYEEGARQKDGKALSAVQWRNMLRSKRACGTVILHQREFDFDTKKYKKIPKEEWIYLENALPPLIDQEYHDRILSILDQRAVSKEWRNTGEGKYVFPKNTGKTVLSGKIYCRACGKKYYFSQNSFRCSKYLAEGRKKPEGRGCDNRRIPQEEMDHRLLEGFQRYYGSEDGNERENDEQLVWKRFQKSLCQELKQIYQKAEHGFSDQKQLRQLEEKFQKTKRNQKQLLNKLLEGVIGDREYQTYYERSCQEEKKLQEKIAVINQQIQKYNNNGVRWIGIEKALYEDEILKKAVIRGFSEKVERIYIEKDGAMEMILRSGERYHFDQFL